MVNGNRFIDVGKFNNLIAKLCDVAYSGKYIKPQKYKFLINAIIELYECILLQFENSRKHTGYLK